jgi:hypothetical protein
MRMPWGRPLFSDCATFGECNLTICSNWNLSFRDQIKTAAVSTPTIKVALSMLTLDINAKVRLSTPNFNIDAEVNLPRPIPNIEVDIGALALIFDIYMLA